MLQAAIGLNPLAFEAEALGAPWLTRLIGKIAPNGLRSAAVVLDRPWGRVRAVPAKTAGAFVPVSDKTPSSIECLSLVKGDELTENVVRAAIERKGMEPVEAAAIGNELRPLLLEHLPDRLVGPLGRAVRLAPGYASIHEPGIQFIVTLEP
jgi:hypothetical protein